MKTIAVNRKARHDYEIIDTIESGIALKGTEVKSIRGGRVSLKESYATISKGEAYVEGMHISPYEHGNIQNVDPLRKRKLLLHKREIMKLEGQIQQKGLTLIPLKVYFKRDKIKLELAVARGKKLYDKRASEAEKSAKRRMDQALRESRK